MSRRDRPRRDARRLEVEHDGLGRDDAGGVDGHRAGYGTGGHLARRGRASRGHRPLHHQQPGQLAPARAADRGGGRSGARLRPGRGRRARAALPAGVHPPLARPHRSSADPALVARLTRLVADARAACSTARARGRWPGSAASSPRASRPRCGTRGGSCSCPRSSCSSPPSLMGAWLARSDAALEAAAPDAAAGGLRRGRLRGVLLVGAGRRVRHRRSRSTTSRWASSRSRSGSSCASSPRSSS